MLRPRDVQTFHPQELLPAHMGACLPDQLAKLFDVDTDCLRHLTCSYRSRERVWGVQQKLQFEPHTLYPIPYTLFFPQAHHAVEDSTRHLALGQ